jgi:general stress protein 26
MATLIDYDRVAELVWIRLAKAAADPADEMRLTAVATVSPDHRPCNRLLLLRGVDRVQGLLWFHTDRRSPKMHHLRTSPLVSILTYDRDLQAQIRLDGRVSVHQHDDLATRHWEQTSMAVRYAYASATGPGAALPADMPLLDDTGPDPQPRRPTADPRTMTMRLQHRHGNLSAGLQNFAVLQVHVHVIDWLQICESGQRRAMLRSDGNWLATALSP